MEKQINIDGLLLNYDESGPDNGLPVILMHGWGCNYSTVQSIANAINSKLKVYSIDLPGHGKSQEPPEPWGIEKFTQLIEKFAATLSIKSPVLIGHSFVKEPEANNESKISKERSNTGNKQDAKEERE